MSGYLIRDYYPRAKNILFPLTGMPAYSPFQPDCYLYWNGEESIDNCELICFYRQNPEVNEAFARFEREVVMKNSKIKACYSVSEGKVYIFDLSIWANDVVSVMVGRYSKLSPGAKSIIRAFHGDNSGNMTKPYDLKEPPIHGFHMAFHPEIYFKLVSETDFGGDITEEELKEVGELWDPPRREKETLDIDIEYNCECVNIPQILY